MSTCRWLGARKPQQTNPTATTTVLLGLLAGHPRNAVMQRCLLRGNGVVDHNAVTCCRLLCCCLACATRNATTVPCTNSRSLGWHIETWDNAIVSLQRRWPRFRSRLQIHNVTGTSLEIHHQPTGSLSMRVPEILKRCNDCLRNAYWNLMGCNHRLRRSCCFGSRLRRCGRK